MLIRKYNGKEQEFDPERLTAALLRAHASKSKIEQIVSAVENQLYPGIRTKDIYRTAFALLRESKPSTAARYNLKHGIMALGPTGFPFENYVAELLKAQGFSTQVGAVVQGQCVKHEVDVIAEKDNEQLMIECKYHSQHGKVCDVKVPLYIYSRFVDVQAAWKQRPGKSEKNYQGWVVTNTRLTADAVQYGKCVGLHLWGWDYPAGKGLKDVIDKTSLYPITCLTTLSGAEKDLLLSKRIVLCKQLCRHPQALTEIGISDERKAKILVEANELVNWG